MNIWRRHLPSPFIFKDMDENSSKKNTWLWPVVGGAVAIFGIVYLYKRKKRQDATIAQEQEIVALIESDHDETALNIGNNSNMAELAQQFYSTLGISRYMGQFIVGNVFTSVSERQALYNLAIKCTNLKDLIQYFNKLTDNALPFLEAISRSDVSDEGKTNILGLLRVQKVVDNRTGQSLGAYKGTAQNGMIEAAKFEANRFLDDNWFDDRELYNKNNVTIVNPI